MADLLFEQDNKREKNQAKRGTCKGSSLNKGDEEKQNERLTSSLAC